MNTNTNTNTNNDNFSVIAQNMFFCQILALTLPIYKQKTGLTPKINFTISEDGLIFDLGFSPRQPNDEELNLFIEEIFDSEKLIINNYILNEINSEDDLSLFKQKITKQIKEIASKRKEFFLNNI